MRLIIEVVDLAGIVCREAVPDFDALLARARDLAAEHPSKMIVAFNIERVDATNFDGFSTSERDRLAICVGEGRRIAVWRKERSGAR